MILFKLSYVTFLWDIFYLNCLNIHSHHGQGIIIFCIDLTLRLYNFNFEIHIEMFIIVIHSVYIGLYGNIYFHVLSLRYSDKFTDDRLAISDWRLNCQVYHGNI